MSEPSATPCRDTRALDGALQGGPDAASKHSDFHLPRTPRCAPGTAHHAI